MISLNRVEGVRTLFLQCVALSFATAFYSLYTQIPGLYGDNGLLPAAGRVNTNIKQSHSIIDLLWKDPNLLQFSSRLGLSVPQMMEVLCLFGTLLGLLITVWPSYNTKPALFVLWLSYLSLYKVGQTFLWFQWDILLLETGFLALLAAPLLPGYERSPLPQDPVTLYLVRWLLFRMMFASGVVKLTSGCPAWWGLTAMPTHYSSQCIPTPLAWFAAQLPDWLHKLSVASTFVIEIPLTFLFFAPSSSLRQFTFINQILLMVLIMLTGNYNFFNFIYMALCLSLADDSWLGGRKNSGPRSHLITRCLCCLLHMAVYVGLGLGVAAAFGLKLTDQLTVDSSVQFTSQQFDTFLSYAVPWSIGIGYVGLIYASLVAFIKLRSIGGGVLSHVLNLLTVLFYICSAFFMFSVSLPSYTGQLDRAAYNQLHPAFKQWDTATARFELTSSYGLFRRMTGVGGRPEIVVEGADNPQGPWTEYRFLYKPGDVEAAPRFCLPHQPRLDWQMWFAALGTYQQNPWFVSLVQRLLEGRSEVLQLLDPESPFKTKPPEYIRARLYTYTFTRWGSGPPWWTRALDREYLPALSLKDGLDRLLKDQGIIGATSVHGQGLLPNLLSAFRRLSDQFPPHIQIWSFAWLALPLFRPAIL